MHVMTKGDNVDILAALLISGIASGPADLFVSTANSLPTGKSKQRLIEMAEDLLGDLYWMRTKEYDWSPEKSFKAVAQRCGGKYLENGDIVFPWGHALTRSHRGRHDDGWYVLPEALHDLIARGKSRS